MANTYSTHPLLPTEQPFTPTTDNTEERMSQIDDLKYFLGTTTNDWDSQCKIRSFHLSAGESISCVFWNDLFHITGTDIVRTLLHRFHLFGRPVTNLKKFEEGIFSDLRNLKPGMDASLEEPKSEFLEMLYKNNCIRTQKKQKVFYWFSVPHDRLFLDALERDLKREKIGLESTSLAVAEPAINLTLDSAQEMFDQLRKSMSLSAVAAAQALDESVIASAATSPQPHHTLLESTTDDSSSSHDFESSWSNWKESSIQNSGHPSTTSSIELSTTKTSPVGPLSPALPSCPLPFESFDYEQKQRIFGAFSLFEGSPTYKQRQRKRTSSLHQHHNQLELAAINAGLAVDPHMFSDESSNEKTFICPLTRCGRVFKRLEHLKRHFRTHTMERPYACNMCGKSFSRTDNLAQHKKTHTRSKNSSFATRTKERNTFSSHDNKPYSDRFRKNHVKTSSSPPCPNLETYAYNTAMNSNCTSPAVSPQLFMPRIGDDMFEMSDALPINSVHDDIVLSDYYPTPPSFMWNPNSSECSSQDAVYPLASPSSTSSVLNDPIPYPYYDDSYNQAKEQQKLSWYSNAVSPTLCPSIYEQPITTEIYSWH
ncbi:homeodomain transcription factor ste12, partial [Rhizopus stolonifer]